jgi:hypothetical protein
MIVNYVLGCPTVSPTQFSISVSLLSLILASAKKGVTHSKDEASVLSTLSGRHPVKQALKTMFQWRTFGLTQARDFV